MAELRKTEAERLLEFVGDAHSVDGPEAFTTELLDRLAEAMTSEFVAYFEFDAESPAAPPLVPVFSSRLEHYVPPPWPYRPPQVPEFAFRPLGHVSLWSDDFQRAMRWRFETAPSARKFEVVDCASATLPAGGSERGVVALFRQGRDFTERDRRALSALGPHITSLIRNAHARRRLADLTAMADAVDGDESSRGYVLLSGGLEVEHASSVARRILGSWFDSRVSRLPSDSRVNRLPSLIEEWLRSGEGHKPLRLERNGTRLVVEAPASRALLVTEERVIPATLTPREREVLRWLAAGKSTSEIAGKLWVTPATVSKHLHNIYRKLGVTSRTAALAATSLYGIGTLDSATSGTGD
jgi:DNA-binding CsgD family transcriptional regulator